MRDVVNHYLTSHTFLPPAVVDSDNKLCNTAIQPESQPDVPLRNESHSDHYNLGSNNSQTSSNDVLPSAGNETHDVGQRETIRDMPKQSSSLYSWGKEIGSIITSIAFLVAIITTLVKYNNETQPVWRYSINLNSVIAIFSTVLRASMLAVIEEVIGQLKWIWYRRSRPLSHFAIFDQASRGPWGSLQYCFQIPRLNLALLGSVLTLLSLGIGPFVQQAIKGVACQKPVKNSHAFLPVANGVGSDGLAFLGGQYQIADMPMKGAAVIGLLDPIGNSTSVSTVCPSGNCTFDSFAGVTHSSLGICSKYSLPNGLFIGVKDTPFEISDYTSITTYINTTGYFESLSPWNRSFDEEYKVAAQASIFNLSILAFTHNACLPSSTTGSDPWSCPHTSSNISRLPKDLNVIAVTCTVYSCLRDYFGEIKKGILYEHLSRTTPVPPPLIEAYDMEFLDNRTIIKQPCIIDGLPYTSNNFSQLSSRNHTLIQVSIGGEALGMVPSDCFYEFGIEWLSAMFNMLDGVFPTGGWCLFGNRRLSDVYCDNEWWLSSLFNHGNASVQSVGHSMDSLATAVTNRIRDLGKDASGNHLGSIRGTVYETTVCTRLDWYWLSFPAILLMVTAILLVMVVAEDLLSDVSQPIWKSSILPLLYLRPWTHEGMSGIENIREMNSHAKREVKFLRRDSGQWEFTDSTYTSGN